MKQILILAFRIGLISTLIEGIVLESPSALPLRAAIVFFLLGHLVERPPRFWLAIATGSVAIATSIVSAPEGIGQIFAALLTIASLVGHRIRPRISLPPLWFVASIASLGVLLTWIMIDDARHCVVAGENCDASNVPSLCALAFALCVIGAALICARRTWVGRSALVVSGGATLLIVLGLKILPTLPVSWTLIRGDLCGVFILAIGQCFLGSHAGSSQTISWIDRFLDGLFVLGGIGLIVAGLPIVFRSIDEVGELGSACVPAPNSFYVSLLTSEDPIFFSHSGVDLARLRNAVREVVEVGKYGRGGSTISMQLAKVLYLSYEKTFVRKLQQIVLGMAIEQRFSKQTILRAYVNRVPFAPGVIGIRAASNYFFKKEPRELTAKESLDLVVTLYDPVLWNPSVLRVPTSVMTRRAVITTRTAQSSLALSGLLRESAECEAGR